VAGVIILSTRRSTRGLAYDARFSDDRIGIFVPGGAEEGGRIEEMFKKAGAVEVRHA
jgi:hypothetical protein